MEKSGAGAQGAGGGHGSAGHKKLSGSAGGAKKVPGGGANGMKKKGKREDEDEDELDRILDREQEGLSSMGGSGNGPKRDDSAYSDDDE